MSAFSLPAPVAAPPVRAPARPRADLRLPSASVLAVVGAPEVQDFLLELAMDRGYGVYCARGTLEALAVYGREAPGAVLVDLDMETGAGLRFLNIFRHLRHHALCVAVTRAPQAWQLWPEVALVSRRALDELADLLVARFE